jgi:predicted PurR-regulated permease PerM
MPDEPQIEPAGQQSRETLRERQKNARRVYLDSSTPAAGSIIRVVVITLFLLAIAGFLSTIIASLTHLFFLIVISVIFAYLIDPLVQLIRRPFKKRNLAQFMPRPFAIVIAYLLLFAVLIVAIVSVAPSVAEQSREFAASLPGYGTALRDRANELNQRFDRLRIPDEMQAEINRVASDIGGGMTASFGNFVLALVGYVPWFLLVPILAFFFLKDANVIRLSVLRMFPAGRWRMRAEAVMADVNTTLAAYTRAQIISCLIIAVISTVGFYLIGLPYALLLGILAGVFEFVPLLGPLAIGLIVTTTAAASDNPWKALYVAVFLIVLRGIHDYITYPRIVRGGVHLHPLAIILAVLAGEQVAGIAGVFISIPIVAVATVIYGHVLEHQGQRGLLSGWIAEAETRAPEEVN